MHIAYHTTASSALQHAAHLARASPYVAVIVAPIPKAEQIAQRLAARYPTITATPTTHSALRRAGVPAVQLCVMPPDRDKDTITMLLWSNLPPTDDGENWQLAIDPDWPLVWRNYQMCRLERGRISWRLSEQARGYYSQRLKRLITGRGGRPQKGEQPYQLPPDAAHRQVLQLAQHLGHYPGFAGIRRDVFDLAQQSTRIWRSTHGKAPYPVWPKMPTMRFVASQRAPLSTLTTTTHQEDTK